MQSKVNRKKNNVIKKSAKLFYYKGYKNTGLNEILRECNIPKGSFYYYFKNKDDLLIHIIDYHTRNLLELFESIVDDLNTKKLETFFVKYFESIAKNDYHGGSLLGNIAMELSDINETVRLKLVSSYKKLELRMEAFFTMIKRTKEDDKMINPEIASKIIINLMEGTMLKLKLNKDLKDLEAFFKVFRYIVNGEDINDKL